MEENLTRPTGSIARSLVIAIGTEDHLILQYVLIEEDEKCQISCMRANRKIRNRVRDI